MFQQICYRINKINVIKNEQFFENSNAVTKYYIAAACFGLYYATSSTNFWPILF